MKLKSFLIFITLTTTVFILQEVIQNNRELIHDSLGEHIRVLAPSEQDYNDQCDGISLPISPKVDKNSGKLLDQINNSRSAKDRSYLQEVLQKKDPKLMDYIMSIIPFVAPFIVLFVFSLIGYWFYCGCVCCDCYIRCCSCCRRNPEKRPYNNCEICWPLICFLVFGGLCIAVCIFGYVATFNFVDSVGQSGCSVSLIFKDIVYGSSDSSIKWAGTTGVVSILTNIKNDINGVGNAVNTAFGGTSTDFIATLESNLSTSIDNIDNGFDTTPEVNVVSPTTGVADTFAIPFFQDVGPKTQSGTLTAELKKGKDDTIISVTDNITSLKTNSQTVQTNVAQISTAMDSAISPVNEINIQINDFGGTATDGLDTVKPFLNYVKIAFIVIFSILIALIGASIVGVLLAKFCKIACCRILIHFGWCCTSWMLIISLLLGVILFTSGLVMDDSCYSLNILITPTELGKISQISSVSQYIQSCLDTTGNPSMSSSLNIESQLNEINAVSTSLNNYQATAKSGSLSSSDFAQLNSAISNIQNLKANPNLLMLSSTYPNIEAANSWETLTTGFTNTISATCGGQDDYFVSNDAQCAAGNATLGTAYGSGTKRQTIMNYLKHRCINVTTFAATTHYTGCGGFNEAGILLLKNTLAEIVTGLGTLQTSVKALQTDFNTEATRTNDFFTNTFSSFKTSIAGVINQVSDPSTGLIAQLDCKWIGQRWEDFDKAFCDSMVPNYSLIGIALLLSAVFNIFVAWCGGCIAIRIAASLKEKKNNRGKSEDDSAKSLK